MVFSGTSWTSRAGKKVVDREVQHTRPVIFGAAALAVVALLWLRWSGVRGFIWADLGVYLEGAGTS